MNPREEGFLLLSSCLGNPERKPLSLPQMRTLAQRVLGSARADSSRDVTVDCLSTMGYGTEMAARIVALLSEEELLRRYIVKAKAADCVPLTRVTEGYPSILRRKLGLDSPGVLWAKGDVSLLGRPGVALAGSRDIAPKNREFAEAVGREAARQGYVLISGNARGADRTAQQACLDSGGSVISVIADELNLKQTCPNLLYLSLEDYDQPFSAQRALTRNYVIHALAEKTFVAQCTLEEGGTWSGTTHNLRNGWSPVFCFLDNSEASEVLEQMGAQLIDGRELRNIQSLRDRELTFFN